MIEKWRFHLLGLVTLLIFPLPALWALWYFEDISPTQVLALDEFFSAYTLIGLQLGFFYALFIIAITQLSVFSEAGRLQEKMLHSLSLNWLDVFLISFAAGFGEEILFRAGIQHWLGPWITTLIFIALHGYFHPLSWKKSLYGVVIFPFILLLAFGYEKYGLWFCIAAHFSYDLLLLSRVRSKSPSINDR